MLAPHDRQNFETLCRAFASGHVALVEVRRHSDQTAVAAVCTIGLIEGEFHITPFALLVEGNPFELFDPPNPDGGYFAREHTNEL